VDYLAIDTRSALGIHTAEERQRYLDTGSHQTISADSTAAELVRDDAAADVEAQAVASEVSVESEAPVVEVVETTAKDAGRLTRRSA
jgi:ribonucleoside-diphosphate reductase alpha chain